VSATHLLLVALVWVCATAAVLGIVYTVLAGVLIGRFFKRSLSEPNSFPPVTIVRPLHGKLLPAGLSGPRTVPLWRA
jgi:ceramide glucosyltransferase